MSDTSHDSSSHSRRKSDSGEQPAEEIPAVKETYLDEDVVVRFVNPDDGKPA